MKRLFLIGASFFITLLLSGCFHSEEKGDELITYYNGWLEIREDEPGYGSLFSLAREEDPEKAKQILNEAFLPVLQDSVDYLENVELEFKEIQELQELHLRVENYFLDLTIDLEEQLENEMLTNSEKPSDEMDDKTNEFEALADKMHTKKDKLMEKYDVYWIIEYDEDGNKLDRLGKDR